MDLLDDELVAVADYIERLAQRIRDCVDVWDGSHQDRLRRLFRDPQEKKLILKIAKIRAFDPDDEVGG